jgi:hypothetical protein
MSIASARSDRNGFGWHSEAVLIPSSSGSSGSGRMARPKPSTTTVSPSPIWNIANASPRTAIASTVVP